MAEPDLPLIAGEVAVFDPGQRIDITSNGRRG
jgi:hypothetical protein